MEQIKNGMLELAKYVAMSQMNGGRIEGGGNNGESEFGKLLEQKNTEARTETAPEKKDAADSAQQTDGKPTEAKKTESGEEEETCDVAREAACAQMVWLVPQTAEVEQPVVQEMSVETVSGEMVNAAAAAGEDVIVQEVSQELQPQEMTGQETARAEELELPVEQTVETVEETVQTETGESAMTQLADRSETRTDVKVKTEETGGEAAAVETPLFKDVEAAPIKVAEAPAETEASDVSSQISEKLTGTLENGESRVEIQLTPESLGKVTVELTRSADGTLSILLNAESAQTRELLAKHVNTLQEAIVDRGQQTVQIEVRGNEETERQHNAQQDLQDGGNGDRPEQQRRRQENSDEDFLQQLRLGLIPNDEES